LEALLAVWDKFLWCSKLVKSWRKVVMKIQNIENFKIFVHDSSSAGVFNLCRFPQHTVKYFSSLLECHRARVHQGHLESQLLIICFL
jgi:hypothetical protein